MIEFKTIFGMNTYKEHQIILKEFGLICFFVEHKLFNKNLFSTHTRSFNNIRFPDGKNGVRYFGDFIDHEKLKRFINS